MMKTVTRVGPLLLFAIISIACNLAQPSPESTPQGTPSLVLTPMDCDQLINTALTTVGSACDALGRNQACYGHRLVDVEFQPGVRGNFGVSGDVVDLFAIHSLNASAFDEILGMWGIAVIKAQANLPDTLPGQNVTFLLYGDTRLENITPDMQAVTLSTGIGEVRCASAPPSAMLVQSPEGVQVAMNINGASVTFGSTLHLTAVQNDLMTISTIEGVAIVQAFATTRIVQPGARVTLPLGTSTGLQVVGPPSQPEPFDITALQHAPLSLLERPVQLPTPVLAPAGETPTPTSSVPAAPPAAPTQCIVNPNWTATYTVQRGDTLFNIARSYNLSVAELAAGNCIADPDRIRAGDVLRVPFAPPQPTSVPTTPPAPAATFTPVPVVFQADQTTLQPRQCTTVHWEVGGASAVYFEGQSVQPSASQDVCPQQTTTYTLLVIQADGTQVPYTLTITVAAPPAATEEPIR